MTSISLNVNAVKVMGLTSPTAVVRGFDSGLASSTSFDTLEELLSASPSTLSLLRPSIGERENVDLTRARIEEERADRLGLASGVIPRSSDSSFDEFEGLVELHLVPTGNEMRRLRAVVDDWGPDGMPGSRMATLSSRMATLISF